MSRRSNVDNLMQKLNLLELIEKAVFKEHEKALIPLVLLKAEETEQEAINPGTELQKKELPNNFYPSKNKINPIINKQGLPESNKEDKFSYQKAFDSLLNSNPDSPFCRMIKDYMVSQLEDTFSESPDQSVYISEGEIKNHQETQHPSSIFKPKNLQKIELITRNSEKNIVEEVKSPDTLMLRKRSSSKGFMRSTNSPVRLRARALKNGSSMMARRSLLNTKINKTEHEHSAPQL